MARDNNREPWSEKDLLVLYGGLSMGTPIQDIATSLNRTADEVLEKAATLKSKLWKRRV